MLHRHRHSLVLYAYPLLTGMTWETLLRLHFRQSLLTLSRDLQSPVTALTWGHNDKRLFVATGGVVHIAWVSRRVASLQLLSRLKVASSLPLGESSVPSLPLPPRIKHLISNLFAQTIRVSSFLIGKLERRKFRFCRITNYVFFSVLRSRSERA